MKLLRTILLPLPILMGFLLIFMGCNCKTYHIHYTLKMKDCPTGNWRTVEISTIFEPGNHDDWTDPFYIQNTDVAVPQLVSADESLVVARNICAYQILRADTLNKEKVIATKK